MNKITLNSQDAFISAIRENILTKSRFIIGSVDAYGTLSFASIPKLHTDSQSARTECARLAKVNPGKLFIFVSLVGGEMLPTRSTISI